MDDSEPPYYWMAEPCFGDMETLQQSMSSEEGTVATGDIPNFATGGATVFASEAG